MAMADLGYAKKTHVESNNKEDFIEFKVEIPGKKNLLMVLELTGKWVRDWWAIL